MKKFLRYTGITTLLTIVVVSLSACGHHHHDPEDKAAWMVKKITRKLDLNEDQQTRLKAVSDEFFAHHRAQQEKNKQHIELLMAEARKPELDKSALNDMFEEHQGQIRDLAPKIIDKLAIFHASLDDEQKEKLVDKLEDFKKHHSQDD